MSQNIHGNNLKLIVDTAVTAFELVKPLADGNVVTVKKASHPTYFPVSQRMVACKLK
jgi:hypothetical protein